MYECEDPKEHNACEKDFISNPATCSFENGKCLKSIVNNSVITCNEITDAAAKSYNDETTKCASSKTALTNFNEEETICKTKKVYSLLTFFLITIALLMADGVYCNLIKYQAKQKHLLPYNATNNKLEEVLY